MQIKDGFVAGGVRPSPYDARDYRLSKKACAINIPEEYMVEYLPRVKDQKSVGSCVAHSLSSIVEYNNFVQEGKKTEMSTGFIYGNIKEGGDRTPGMCPRNALQNLQMHGDCTKKDFPENIERPEAVDLFNEKYEGLKDKAYKYRISNYFRLYTEEEIKTAIMKYGLVTFSIPWYTEYSLTNDVLKPKSNKVSGHHMVTIYGWNKNGYLMQNSWGIFWGRLGRCVLSYDYKISEAWGVVDNIVNHDDEDIVTPYKSAIGRFFVKIINLFANLFAKIMFKLEAKKQ